MWRALRTSVSRKPLRLLSSPSSLFSSMANGSNSSQYEQNLLSNTTSDLGAHLTSHFNCRNAQYSSLHTASVDGYRTSTSSNQALEPWIWIVQAHRSRYSQTELNKVPIKRSRLWSKTWRKRHECIGLRCAQVTKNRIATEVRRHFRVECHHRHIFIRPSFAFKANLDNLKHIKNIHWNICPCVFSCTLSCLNFYYEIMHVYSYVIIILDTNT